MTRPASTRGLVYTTSTFSESTIAGKATCFIPKSQNRSKQQDRDELRLGGCCPSLIAPTDSCAKPAWLSPPSVLSLGRGVFAGRSQPLLPTGSSRRYLCESFPGCLIPYPGGSTECFYLFLLLWHRPSPKKERGRLPQFLANTTFHEVRFRGCRYFFMFRRPSLLVSKIVPTAAILPQGSRDFYLRADRDCLLRAAPVMLTVRI